MYLLACSGDVSVVAGGPQCSGAWILVRAPEQFDPSQLDPVQVGQAFGAGFGLVASILVLSLGVKAILDFIKRG